MQNTTGKPFQKIQNAIPLRINLIRLLKLGYAVGTTVRAAALPAQVVPIAPGHELLLAAATALVDGEVKEPLGKPAVYTHNRIAAASAFPHGGSVARKE